MTTLWSNNHDICSQLKMTLGAREWFAVVSHQNLALRNSAITKLWVYLICFPFFKKKNCYPRLSTLDVKIDSEIVIFTWHGTLIFSNEIRMKVSAFRPLNLILAQPTLAYISEYSSRFYLGCFVIILQKQWKYSQF